MGVGAAVLPGMVHAEPARPSSARPTNLSELLYRPALCSSATFYHTPRHCVATLVGMQRLAKHSIVRHSTGSVAIDFSALLSNGLRWTPVGIDVTPVLQARDACRPACHMADADISAILALPFNGGGPFSRPFWLIDQPARAAPECCSTNRTLAAAPPPSSALRQHVHKAATSDRGAVSRSKPGKQATSDDSTCQTQPQQAAASIASKDALGAEEAQPGHVDPILRDMLSDGYAIVNDWGLDMESLSAQAQANLENSAAASNQSLRSLGRLNSLAPLPALTPLLNNASLAAAIRAYFGGPARYEGCTTFYLSANATEQTYAAGQWHHDRCGRRLKLWIYVHDVLDWASHPTVVASGSHNMVWHSYAGGSAGWLSRFQDSFVRAHHKVVPMIAPRGGGFVFDTNALVTTSSTTALHSVTRGGHRTTTHARGKQRPQARVAVILEFHPHGKITRALNQPAAKGLFGSQAAAAAKLGPCPSFKAIGGRTEATWMLVPLASG